ncbi:unnamed protein product [Nippostrongylus brasiliensis]|uniref:Carbonic anhydrase n=1 Tax=Nippostrongylus brasiliensis TaxID=27835 RepID=A0A0N4YJY2_NIPBR|nr:unnamed protein product [Nippostrongylus brasiliensis]
MHDFYEVKQVRNIAWQSWAVIIRIFPFIVILQQMVVLFEFERVMGLVEVARGDGSDLNSTNGLCSAAGNLISDVPPCRFRGSHSHSEEWGYQDDHTWKGVCKTGFRQSPIDLDISDAVVVHWKPLEFHNYNARGSIIAESNHHTELVKGFQSWSKKPYITGGNLGAKYYLRQFHFHWDGNDRFGSEHTLHGLHYPLEVHFVHIREGLNESTAGLVHGGVAVVAVQFQLATKGEALFNLDKVTNTTNRTGSLTTPPCSEGVIWTILAQPNFVSNEQLDTLRQHLKQDGSLLIHNWRAVQPMNGRTLFLNKKLPKKEPKSMDVALEVAPIIVVCIMIVIVIA